MAKKRQGGEKLDFNEANERLSPGWTLGAFLAAAEAGYICADVIGAIVFPTGAYAVGMYIKKRRGHETKGKKSEWWTIPEK